MGQSMGTSQRREPAVAGPPEPMSHSIEGRARPASKGARSSPEFSTIWGKADLADTVVSFLPADSVGRLPLVSRAQRDAQPRVLFAAARERGVAGELALACVETLRGADRDLVHHHFRETWSDGISERWFADGHDGCTAALVGTPPRLELRRVGGHGHGGCLRYDLCDNDDRLSAGMVSRLRVQMSASNDWNASSFFLLCGNSQTTTDDDDDLDWPHDYLALNPIVGLKLIKRRGVCQQLRWLAPMDGIPESSHLLVDEYHPNDAVMWYTVDAVFPYNSSVVLVSVNGGPYKRIGCRRSRDIRSIHLYPNGDGGTARYGDIEVWYSEELFVEDYEPRM
jgi:hypothetical protein